ncbi:MAG: hypothetical protein AABX70_04315 [Nanoarchaeota archaeon]
MKRLQNLDNSSRTLLLLITVFVAYLIFIPLLHPFFNPEGHVSECVLSASTPNIKILNILAVILSLMVGFLVSLKLKSKSEGSGKDELSILKKALSKDEQKLLEEVQKAKEITQDSLRFRLDWSKAKVSAILNNLDRMDLVQRERVGKTYNVIFKGR